MNEQFVLNFIRQRMQQFGVSCYHFEPVFFMADIHKPVEMQLDNEWWYLVGFPDNINIISDSAFYNRSGTTLNTSYAPEFTGKLNITFISPPIYVPPITGVGASLTPITLANEPDLKFIRVIIQKA